MAIDVEDVYRRYAPMVRRRCTSMLADGDAARDAAQEVFVRLVVHADHVDDAGLSSLLWLMATRECLTRLRSRRRRPEDPPALLEAIAAADDPEDRISTKRLLSHLFSAMPEELRASTRALAVLHYVDGLTLEETAQAARMSVSGVRKRLRTLQQRVQALREGELRDGAPPGGEAS